MRIDSVTRTADAAQVSPKPAARPAEGFADVIADTAKQVSQLEKQADSLAQKVAAGDVMEIHNAMLAMNKASSALELTVQVRNKVLEAYQEIMRMQM